MAYIMESCRPRIGKACVYHTVVSPEAALGPMECAGAAKVGLIPFPMGCMNIWGSCNSATQLF